MFRLPVLPVRAGTCSARISGVLVVLSGVWLMAGAGQAQSVDCANALTQSDMNHCAGLAYGEADAELNRVWKGAVATARQRDTAISDMQQPSEEMLRQAQRLWIAYRDAACEAESTLVRGGSMQPMVRASCLERLTRDRTRDLTYFAEGMK